MMNNKLAGYIILLLAVFSACSNDKTTAPIEEPEGLKNIVWAANDTAAAQTKLALDVYVENNQPLTGLVLPLQLRGENFSIDSVSMINSRFVQNEYCGSQVYPDDLQLAVWFYPSGAEPIDSGSGLGFRVYLWIWGNAPTQDIIIDTTTIEHTTRLGYIDTAYLTFMPEFKAGILHVDSLPSRASRFGEAAIPE